MSPAGRMVLSVLSKEQKTQKIKIKIVWKCESKLRFCVRLKEGALI